MINAAHETLMDPEGRSRYDAELARDNRTDGMSEAERDMQDAAPQQDVNALLRSLLCTGTVPWPTVPWPSAALRTLHVVASSCHNERAAPKLMLTTPSFDLSRGYHDIRLRKALASCGLPFMPEDTLRSEAIEAELDCGKDVVRECAE